MNESDEFYIKSLYPFQDGILNILRELKLPFYLTGGTPLSRIYFKHRYSDDLDLFVNDDSSFSEYCNIIFNKLADSQTKLNFIIDKQKLNRSNNFMQVYISKADLELKIDLVNDVAPHYDEFYFDAVLGKIDSLRNILSNKFSALYRFEPKDIVDIWIICKNFKCNFKEIISEAKNKEAGVDPVSIFEILSSFPVDKLNLIKWINKPDPIHFKNDLSVIADDIFNGRINSLVN
ncbi:MAG: nucleotidyl transferase AbiEii/AbiGii toxin family protein [Ignavibacteriales bacterium]|nr:nucleotidyl transferase AbiEii/AbiGii toxin family protein [Ignavibacteriales bacterium]